VAWRASLDDGRTWSAPTHVSGPLGTNVRFPPIETDAGRVLLPAYDDLFQRSLIFKLGGAPRAAVLQAVLETGLTRGNIQPALAQRADGVILAVMRNSARGGLWVAASRDDGATWSQPWNSGLPNPGSPALLMRLASGNLLLVYNDHLTERTRLTAALSRDDGATWSFRRVLVDEPGAHSYPAATQDDAGLIHLVYSHDRATIRHITLNEAWLQAAAADP
jgi:predicted neuraminidase